MTNTKKTIEVEITDERLCDLVETALEGGIAYWARRYETRNGKDPRRCLLAGKGIDLVLNDGDIAPRDLSLDALREGIAKIMALPRTDRRWFQRSYVMTFLGDSEDATTADVLVQWAVFGEVIYG